MKTTILDIAQYLCKSYAIRHQAPISELPLHKLLYLCQRESLAVYDRPLFEDAFQGWKLGPVSARVRSCFDQGNVHATTHALSGKEQLIVESVLEQYGNLPASELVELSHQENSWIRSRQGLDPEQAGHTLMTMEDIRTDARNVRIFDPLWGVYVDELEDYDRNDNDKEGVLACQSSI